MPITNSDLRRTCAYVSIRLTEYYLNFCQECSHFQEIFKLTMKGPLKEYIPMQKLNIFINLPIHSKTDTQKRVYMPLIQEMYSLA